MKHPTLGVFDRFSDIFKKHPAKVCEKFTPCVKV